MNGRKASETIGENENLVFGHQGISYDANKRIVTFSDEARAELEGIIKETQARLNKQGESLPHQGSNTKVTTENVQNATDMMLSDNKSKRTISHFVQRAKDVLKRKGGKKKVHKVEEKIEKYVGTNDKAVHLFLRYHTDGVEKAVDDEVPLIIWPNGDFDGILSKYSTRLRGFGLGKNR